MFHLEWLDKATSELTDGWLIADSSLRADITAAIHEIERRLLRAPERAGESRAPGTRVMILYPLVVSFHVNTRTDTVLIWRRQVPSATRRRCL